MIYTSLLLLRLTSNEIKLLGMWKSGKFSKLKKVVRIAIDFNVALVVGDRTASVAAVVASLLSHG